MLAPGSVMGRALGPLGTAGYLAAHPLAAEGWGAAQEQPPSAAPTAGTHSGALQMGFYAASFKCSKKCLFFYVF